MSQDTGDPVVQSGDLGSEAFFRLSTAIAALRSLQSGASAPAAAAAPAGALWLDTSGSDDIVRERDSAAAAWLPRWLCDAGPLALVPSTVKTSTFTISSADGVTAYLCDCSSASLLAQLNGSMVRPFQVFFILVVDGTGTDSVDVDPTGGDVWIDTGDGSIKSLEDTGDYMAVFYDGSSWWQLFSRISGSPA